MTERTEAKHAGLTLAFWEDGLKNMTKGTEAKHAGLTRNFFQTND